MDEERVMVLLKPKASADEFMAAAKEFGLKFKKEKVMDMGAQGPVVVGFCNKAVIAALKKLPNVDDVEESQPVHIMKKDSE